MAETSTAHHADSDRPPVERRARVRHSCDREGNCLPVLAGQNFQWSARVLNISQGGVALSLRRRFEKGTLLSVEMQRADNLPSDPFLARVVHVTAQPDGNWLIGCAFADELSDQELQALL
jgi:hypothetical protein